MLEVTSSTPFALVSPIGAKASDRARAPSSCSCGPIFDSASWTFFLLCFSFAASRGCRVVGVVACRLCLR